MPPHPPFPLLPSRQSTERRDRLKLSFFPQQNGQRRRCPFFLLSFAAALCCLLFYHRRRRTPPSFFPFSPDNENWNFSPMFFPLTKLWLRGLPSCRLQVPRLATPPLCSQSKISPLMPLPTHRSPPSTASVSQGVFSQATFRPSHKDRAQSPSSLLHRSLGPG